MAPYTAPPTASRCNALLPSCCIDHDVAHTPSPTCPTPEAMSQVGSHQLKVLAEVTELPQELKVPCPPTTPTLLEWPGQVTVPCDGDVWPALTSCDLSCSALRWRCVACLDFV